jgi:RTX calcium-binding nonapeptide repeat (4 copies)
MKKKLGIVLAGGMTVVSALVLPVASPVGTRAAGAAVYQNGSWYCFGHKATKTVPDAAYPTDKYGPGWNEYSTADNPYRGSVHDVIVGTDGNDVFYDVSPGDVVCGRGGNDDFVVSPWINPKLKWNRVRIDAGKGNDVVETTDDDLSGPGPWATWEIHTGPGNDRVEGGPGNDEIFLDSSATKPSGAQYNQKEVSCGTGADVLFLSKYIHVAPLFDTTDPMQGAAPRSCERTASYPGYKRGGFVEFRPTPVSPTPTPSPTPVTTSPPPGH